MQTQKRFRKNFNFLTIPACIQTTLLVLLLCSFTANVYAESDDLPAGEKRINLEAIHPELRQQAAPAGGREVGVNPPAMLWPVASGKSVTYNVRLSQAPDFPENKTITAEALPFAMYNNHALLEEGKWYWQYAVVPDGAKPLWSETFEFTVSASARRFATPSAEAMLAAIPASHPRLLMTADKLAGFRKRMQNSDEAQTIVEQARQCMDKKLPTELDGLTKKRADTARRSERLALDASKGLGNNAYYVCSMLSKAYIITGDESFARQAVRWAMRVASWEPYGLRSGHPAEPFQGGGVTELFDMDRQEIQNFYKKMQLDKSEDEVSIDSNIRGITGINDFGDAACMIAMARVYDSCYDLLTDRQKDLLQKRIKQRAERFYPYFVNRLEAELSNAHVWQHHLHYLIEAAFATLGDIPEAEKWAVYGYEIWLNRMPTLGGDDGGWANGNSYIGANVETLIDVPMLFGSLVGVNFFDIPWYKNNIYWLIYTQPPGSYTDGFADGHEKYRVPSKLRVVYADALAREFNDPYAAWYVEKSMEGTNIRVKSTTPSVLMTESLPPRNKRMDGAMRWYRLCSGKERPEKAEPSGLAQARFFPDVGVVTMHTNLADSSENLMVTFRASPFGSHGHAQADNNVFNILYGGKRLWYSTGYYNCLGDKHHMGWYVHTRSHNGILINGRGQPYNSAEAYGWMPRYLHGKQITYCVGDSAGAYQGKLPSRWQRKIEELGMQQLTAPPDVELERFRRHVLLLRPSTVVVYDELKAAEPVDYSWLVHNMQEVAMDSKKQRLTGAVEDPYSHVDLIGEGFLLDEEKQQLWQKIKDVRSQLDLFASVPLKFDMTNRFLVPSRNWRLKMGKDGKILQYPDNKLHFSAIPVKKTDAIRFLAIFQVKNIKQCGGFDEPAVDKDGWYKVGSWKIRAELDTSKQAALEVRNLDGTAALTTGKTDGVTVAGEKYKHKQSGSTLLVEETDTGVIVKEAVDQLPEAAK